MSERKYPLLKGYFLILTLVALLAICISYIAGSKKFTHALFLFVIVLPLLEFGGLINATLYLILIVLFILATKRNSLSGGFSPYFKRILFLGTAFVVWGLLSSFLAATSLSAALITMHDQAKVFLLFILMYLNIRNTEDMTAAVKAILIGLAFQAFIGFFQWRYGTTGLSIIRDAFGSWRATGSMQLPNLYAAYILFTIIFPLGLLIFRRIAFDKRTLQMSGLIFISVFCLYASFSRSAWIGFLGQFIFLLLLFATRKGFRSRIFSSVFVVMIMMLPVMTIYGGYIIKRFERAEISMLNRDILVDAAFYTIKTKPMFGVGPNNYAKWGHPSFISYRREGQRTPENSFLQIAVEYGLPAVLLFILMFVVTFWYGFRLLRRLRSKGPFVIGATILTSLFGFVVQSFGVPEFRHFPVQVLFWYELGIIASLERLDHLLLKKYKDREPAETAQIPSA